VRCSTVSTSRIEVICAAISARVRCAVTRVSSAIAAAAWLASARRSPMSAGPKWSRRLENAPSAPIARLPTMSGATASDGIAASVTTSSASGEWTKRLSA
jgi:hypothetical protein